MVLGGVGVAVGSENIEICEAGAPEGCQSRCLRTVLAFRS